MNLMIGIPCMDNVATAFCRSLVGLAVPEHTPYCFMVGSMIYAARNKIVTEALQNNMDLILWLDSDIAFEPDLLSRLFEDMNKTKADVVTGLYFTRAEPLEPVIYSTLETKQEGDYMYIKKDVYDHYPKNKIFEIAGCGFGAVLTTVDICKKIIENYGAPFTPLPGMGEDLTFCYKAREMGAKIMCDSGIKLEHVGYDSFNEERYKEQQRKKKK